MPLPQFVGRARRSLRGDRAPARGAPAVRARRAIDRLLVANGVRTDLEIALFDVDHGPRLRQALSRRAARAPRAPEHRGRRRRSAWALARNGHCARGAALLEARAPARARATRSSTSTAGWSSAASATAPRRARGSAARSRSTRTSPCCGRRWRGGSPMRRARRRARVALAARRAAGRWRPRIRSATSRRTATAEIQLSGEPRLRALRPRPRRDPDLPGQPRSSARERRATARRSPSGCAPASRSESTARRRPARRSAARSPSRPVPPACRRRASRPSTTPARVGGPLGVRSPSRLQLPRPDRVARGRRNARPTAPRVARVDRAGTSGQRSRSARYPSEPAAEPARRRARPASGSSRPDGRSAAAPRARSSVDARRAAAPAGETGFAALIQEDDLGVGVVLVSLLIAMFWGAAHALTPGPRKGDRRRLPRRHARARRAHAFLLGGITRSRTHSACSRSGLVTLAPLGVHRPRAALPVAQPRLGAARRRRRHRRAPLPRALAAHAAQRTRMATTTTHDHDHHSRHHGHHHRRHGTTTVTTHHAPEPGSGLRAWSPSASPADCSRARPRSSCCSRRSRSTASATACC